MIFEGTNANEHNPLSDKERKMLINSIEEQMKHMMVTLNIDIREDHNSKDTPKRFAKMLINETMAGRYGPAPVITTFPNSKEYDQAIMSGPIRIESMCSHHWQPFIGEAYIAYLPDETVIGLSKLSRIAIFYAKRPQIQEELTQQIANHIEEVLGSSKGVAVMIRFATSMYDMPWRARHKCKNDNISIAWRIQRRPSNKGRILRDGEQ